MGGVASLTHIIFYYLFTIYFFIMKTILNYFLVGILLVSVSSCYRVKPDGDQESVIIKKPLFFGHGGLMMNQYQQVQVGAYGQPTIKNLQ